MTIAVSCPQCRRTINAGERFAGKRVRCPDCQTVVEVPAAPAPPQSAVQPQPAPAAALFVRLPDGRQVGPLTQAALTQAVQQGQVSANCHIWQQGWPQPRWAGELFPALAQQAPTPPQGHAPPMGNAAAIVYPPGAGQTPGPPQGYGFDPLSGGYGAVGQHAAPQSAPAMLGIPQVPWGSMQGSSSAPKKKKRRDGPFGRPTDGRGFAIVMVICGIIVLREVIATGIVLVAVAEAAAEAEKEREAERNGRGIGRVRKKRSPPVANTVVGWIITASLVAGMVSRKSSAQSGTAGLLLVRALLCAPLQVSIAGGEALLWAIAVPFILLDVAMAVVLAASPSVKIYFDNGGE